MRGVAPCPPAAAALQRMGDTVHAGFVWQGDELGIQHRKAGAYSTPGHDLDALPTELAEQDRWRIGTGHDASLVRTKKEHLAESARRAPPGNAAPLNAEDRKGTGHEDGGPYESDKR